MSKSQRNQLVDRIVYRFQICRMTFTDAVKDVLHWFGTMDERDVIYITTKAGKKCVA